MQPTPDVDPHAIPLRPPGPEECRFCGARPAAKVTFRGHQGMVLVMRFLHTDGPFCRGCGLAVFRSMTAKTLYQGWWGYASFVITPGIVLLNLFRRSRVARLEEPYATPGLLTPQSRPLDPGKPLYQRPAILGLLLPVALVAAFVAMAASDSGTGECVRVSGNRGTVVSCSQSHQEKVIATVERDSDCPADAEGYMEYNGKVLCTRAD
ncbi:hypothetical protein R8Z50_04310 [Longispora sp. K20-0274]|uniref:hypothetical protein n=1 Tax=Longispora sp. K20-0274 TaxID=3088255 RepID=UPI00399B7D8B